MPVPGESAKDDWLFSLDASPNADARAGGMADLDGPLGLDDAFVPPSVKPARMPTLPGVQTLAGGGAAAAKDSIPTNWNLSLADGDAAAPSPAQPPQVPPADGQRPQPGSPVPPRGTVGDEAALLRAFLEGAGIGALADRLRDPAETMHGIGEIFRIVVVGLIASL